MLESGRLTADNIQQIYNAISEYTPVSDPTGRLAQTAAATALCFAAQVPLDAEQSFVRRDLHLYLFEKTGLPIKEADVLCTLLCSVLAVAFPIFTGPADPVAAQHAEARFTLNPACAGQVDMYRVLLGLSPNDI